MPLFFSGALLATVAKWSQLPFILNCHHSSKYRGTSFKSRTRRKVALFQGKPLRNKVDHISAIWPIQVVRSFRAYRQEKWLLSVSWSNFVVFWAGPTTRIVSIDIQEYIWVIDQACGQDGWILTKFFFCDTKSRSINTQKKKERDQYPAILNRISLRIYFIG